MGNKVGLTRLRAPREQCQVGVRRDGLRGGLLLFGALNPYITIGIKLFWTFEGRIGEDVVTQTFCEIYIILHDLAYKNMS